jgi:hypothetical protein
MLSGRSFGAFHPGLKPEAILYNFSAVYLYSLPIAEIIPNKYLKVFAHHIGGINPLFFQ